MTCTLYRQFDASGALLYVGIADDPRARMRRHAAQSAWASLIARVTLDHFEDREKAEAAERQAIFEEKPLHNIQLADREGAEHEDVARRIRSLRVASRLSQAEYAKSLGFKVTQYSNWENGFRQPSIAAAIKICDAEAVTLDWLFRGIA